MLWTQVLKGLLKLLKLSSQFLPLLSHFSKKHLEMKRNRYRKEIDANQFHVYCDLVRVDDGESIGSLAYYPSDSSFHVIWRPECFLSTGERLRLVLWFVRFILSM